MGWDKGKYYTRSRKVDGRVVREYVGSGRLAAVSAERDARGREQRRNETQAVRQEMNCLDELDGELRALAETAEVIARAALVVAGFRQHKRGEWRKRREQVQP